MWLLMLGISMLMLNDTFCLSVLPNWWQTYQLCPIECPKYFAVKYSNLLVMCLNFYWISVLILLALYIPITHLTFSLEGPDNMIVKWSEKLFWLFPFEHVDWGL